jgi:hypothetical protein
VRVEGHHADLKGLQVEAPVGTPAHGAAHVGHLGWIHPALDEQPTQRG